MSIHQNEAKQIDKNLKSILINHDLNETDKSYTKLTGKHLPKKIKAAISKWVSESLSNPEFYSSFAVRGKKVDKFVNAYVPKSGFECANIVIGSFSFSNAMGVKEIRHEIKNLKTYFPKAKKIVLRIPNNFQLKDDLFKMGFKLRCYELVAKTKDSLNALNNCDDLGVLPLQIRDLKSALDLDVISCKSDKSIYIKRYTKKHREEMTGYYKRAIKNQSCFGLKNNKKLIGVIFTIPNPAMSLIGSIGVHPNFQGKGIAKALYKAALKDLLKRRCYFYKGNTTTTKVLHLSKMMKRKLNGMTLDMTY